VNDKVYIHELIEITGQARARYMHHMTANWGPQARKERNQLCFGVWGTIGSTGRWPEVVNLWEEAGWDGLARNFAHETGHPGMQDPTLAAWWAEAAQYRRGGFDRILIPAPWMPTIEELCARGVRGVFYAHELVELVPGRAPAYLEHVREHALPLYRQFGLELVGALRTALRNDSEAVVIWAIPEPAAWARFERAWHGEPPHRGVAAWRGITAGEVVDWRRTLLVDAPLCPLRTGRQPQESDRRPLDAAARG
jgi:hypothetical protein